MLSHAPSSCVSIASTVGEVRSACIRSCCCCCESGPPPPPPPVFESMTLRRRLCRWSAAAAIQRVDLTCKWGYWLSWAAFYYTCLFFLARVAVRDYAICKRRRTTTSVFANVYVCWHIYVCRVCDCVCGLLQENNKNNVMRRIAAHNENIHAR